MKIIVCIFIFISTAFAEEIQFEKKKIHVGATPLTVELAVSYEQQARGLMFRKKVSDGEGMLFIFPEEKTTSFWMKNTLIPLSLGYFDKNKTLNEVKDLDPASSIDTSPPVYANKIPAKYVLEVSKGWFQRKKIKIGEKLRYEN